MHVIQTAAEANRGDTERGGGKYSDHILPRNPPLREEDSDEGTVQLFLFVSFLFLSCHGDSVAVDLQRSRREITLSDGYQEIPPVAYLFERLLWSPSLLNTFFVIEL